MSRRGDFRQAGLGAILVALAAACGAGPEMPAQTVTGAPSPGASVTPQAKLPAARLQILRNGERVALFSVEMARTPEQQAAGLMGRTNLKPDAGMAFINDTPSTTPFYMQNTLIALDLAFWGEDRKIFQIVQMEPCRKTPCPLYPPDRPYLGALELNRGTLEKEGVRIGDEVVLTVTVAR
ncbi:MAG: DUF192 domain-containing protein [Actinomycetota bacterium]